jgi:hypothetical protein
VERAILQGVVGETTAALLRDREARRPGLRARLEKREAGATPMLSVERTTVHAMLGDLQELLQTDPSRVNGVFRTYLGPITGTPEEADGKRF